MPDARHELANSVSPSVPSTPQPQSVQKRKRATSPSRPNGEKPRLDLLLNGQHENSHPSQATPASSRRPSIPQPNTLTQEATTDEYPSTSPDDLDDFVPVSTAKEQEDIIRSGLAPLKKVYAPNRDQNFELSLQNVCDIINLLYVMAQAKGHAFTEGVYVLDDNEGKLFEALTSALEEQHLNDKKLRRQNLAKERSSSHSIGETKDQSKHYGIDFAKDATLHSHMKHLLFFSFKGLDRKKKLFLKPEKHGVNMSDFSSHACDYILTTVMRETGMTNGHNAAYRKERLKSLYQPLQRWLNFFISILQEKLGKNQMAEREKNIQLFGLSYVYSCCTTLLEQNHPEPTQQVINLCEWERQQVSGLKNYIEENFDHLECRKGGEVIFDLEELGIAT